MNEAESNRYELFYITAMEVLEHLISDTINNKNTKTNPYDEYYHAGYLNALQKVKLSFERQADLFNIPIK
ncbi:hypothetical protein CISECK367B_23590 [Citrobacter sedlakii]